MKKWNDFKGEDFTFVICTYKECSYLEECIQSIINQTVKTKVLISTSTPNDFVYALAKKYSIDVLVNPKGGQVNDYNFALKQGDTKLVMLAHQDEILNKKFVEKVLFELNHTKNPIIAFTNYVEMHNDIIDKKPSIMVRIKRIMLLPFYIKKSQGTRFGKWIIQCLGNPIAHPSVVCVRKEMPEVCFKEKYKASMDWDLWERLSRQKGAFVYVRDILLYHRMNDDNQTAKLIATSNVRYEEEYEIMQRFWPRPIAKVIMHFYKKASNFY